MESTPNSRHLKKILKSQRMISVRNCTDVLETDIPSISQILIDFKKEGYLRIVQPKGCLSACSSCSSCSSTSNHTLSSSDTIISLIYRRDDDHVYS